MNSGRFFALDLKSSRIEEGIAVFNYTDLFDAMVNEGEGQSSPKYPIFVTITSASVKFVLQYCVYEYNRRFTFTPTQNSLEIRHMEEVLIELPLEMTAGLPLSSILKRLYATPFPIKLQGTCKDDTPNYILELIRRRYEGAEELQYKYALEKDKNDISYSPLFVWGLREENKYILYNKENKYDKFLRKLILDFFFDMMHGDVFKNSAHFDKMYGALMSDFFCSSIICKSEFFYQRELVNDKYKNPIDKNLNGDKLDGLSYLNSISIYAENFDLAEKNWVEKIQVSQSDKQFEFLPNWFEGDAKGPLFSFKEPYKSFCRVIRTLCSGIKSIWDLEFKIHDNLWFANPEEELRRVYFPLKQKRNTENIDQTNTESILNSSDLCNKLRRLKKRNPQKSSQQTKVEEKMSYDQKRVLQRRTSSSKWLFKRYDFCDAFGLSFSSSKYFLPNAIFFIALFVISVLVLLGWIGLVCISLCGMIVFVLLHIVIKKSLLSDIHFIFPRLIASITAAWLTVALSEDLFKAFFDSKWSLSSTSFLLGAIFIFVLYEVDKIVPRISSLAKLGRALELVLISFVISITVGLLVINFTGERFLERSDMLSKFYRDNVLIVSGIGNGKRELKLNFEEGNQIISDSILINKYTHTPDSPLYNVAMARTAVEYFVDSTNYEDEFLERIAIINRLRISYRDSLLVLTDSCEQVKDTTKCLTLVDEQQNICTHNVIDTLVGNSSHKMNSQQEVANQQRRNETRAKFLLRHENNKLFKDLLEYVEHKDGDDTHSIATFFPIPIFGGKFFVLWDFLVQFAVVAMFIGIFIQMIFEEKNITES